MESISGDGFGCNGRQLTSRGSPRMWAFPCHRKAMMWASLITAPLSLTEPLFVPDYWNPPSLFDLARRSGFDIESVIFSFAIGGIGAVLYNLLTGRALLPISAADRHSPHHKMHYCALAKCRHCGRRS